MRIRIKDGAITQSWYRVFVVEGCTFEVVEEFDDRYYINIGGVKDKYSIYKKNCEVVKEIDENSAPVETPRFTAGEKVWVRNSNARQWENVVFRMRYDGVYYCSDIVVPRRTQRRLTGWDFICSEDAVEKLEQHIFDVRDKLNGLVTELKTFKKEEII